MALQGEREENGVDSRAHFYTLRRGNHTDEYHLVQSGAMGRVGRRSARLRRLAEVEIEEAAQARADDDLALGAPDLLGGKGDDVVEALVITLVVVVLDVLRDGAAQRGLSDGYDRLEVPPN
jgi:hypothetical protein